LKIFRANSVFRASQVASKIPNDKNFSIQLKIAGQLYFSGQAQVAQKSRMIKNISKTVKNCRATLFFRASASWSKVLNDKNISIQWKISRQLCFSGKVQVAQKS